jgi:hypothetical protein
MGEACNTYGERRDAYRVFGVKNEGKRPLGVPRNRGHNDNKMYLEEVG